jgi:glycosyltransferase involved in cell wall biosynthesis
MSSEHLIVADRTAARTRSWRLLGRRDAAWDLRPHGVALRNRATPVLAGAAPIKVAVLVDLLLSDSAGGHVKFWQRAAAGATRLGEQVDLTVHFAGEADEIRALAPHIRFMLHRPIFSTRQIPFLSHIPDHTDLAPHHPRLARALSGSDVIHTTDGFFCFAHTALRTARRHAIPVVNSVHTDTPRYARLYAEETVRRLCGDSVLSRWLIEEIGIGARAERRKRAQLAHHQSHCAFVLGPREEDREAARRVLPPARVRPLMRGLEIEAFHPRRRDREWLQSRFGIAPATTVVLMVGRVNAGKNVMIVARAIATLAAAGHDVCLFCAGEGEERRRVSEMLGPNACCPGVLLGPDMERVFAAADLLAHPAAIEAFGNAVSEGMAAGLPALVHAYAPTRAQIEVGVSGLAVGPREQDWAAAIAGLVEDPQRRAAMSRAARAHIERIFSNWDAVVAGFFLPVWREAVASAKV